MMDMPKHSQEVINIMYLPIVLTFALIIFQSYVVKKTNSQLIATDKLHYFIDFLTHISVIISLYLSAQFWYIDAVIGIFISLYIIRSSFVLFKSSIKNLVDEEFAPEDRDRIIKIIKNFPEARGWHELKTRSAGNNKPFIQFHLEIDSQLSLIDAHSISDRVETRLRESFPNAEIIIHQDPV